MNQSFFLRTFCHSALAFLEPQIYIVEEHFGAENISLLSGRLVSEIFQNTGVFTNCRINEKHEFI